MRLSGYDGVSRALMRVKRDHLRVQVEPSAKVGSVSAIRDMGDHTVTGQYALRIVESQKEEEFVIQ